MKAWLLAILALATVSLAQAQDLYLPPQSLAPELRHFCDVYTAARIVAQQANDFVALNQAMEDAGFWRHGAQEWIDYFKGDFAEAKRYAMAQLVEHQEYVCAQPAQRK